MQTSEKHPASASPNTDAVIVTVRGRPVRLAPGFCGWSANAVERGFFPVSHTGYRSFATGLEAGDPPSLEVLESLARDFDRDRAKALKNAHVALQKRFRTIPDGVVSFDGIGRHIDLSMAAQRALEHGTLAPEAERVALWEVAYLLYDRLARDPLVRPQPVPDHRAWDSAVCDEAVSKCAHIRDCLGNFMRGDCSSANGEYPLYTFRYLVELEGTSLPAQPVPMTALFPFPTPLTDHVEPNADMDPEEGGEGLDEDSGEDGAEETDAEEENTGCDPIPVSACVGTLSQQLVLF